MADRGETWITVYPTIARESRSDLTYGDVVRGLMSMFDVTPIDPGTDGRAHTWTFTPKRGGMGDAEN